MDQKTKQLILQETIKTLHAAALKIEVEINQPKIQVNMGDDYQLFVDHEGWHTLMSAVEYLRESFAGNQSERSGPETRDFPDERDDDPIVVFRVRLVDLDVKAMKPEDAVLEIAGFSSSAEYPSVMDIAAALASNKVFRSRQSVYAMNIDEGLGAALIPVDLVLDAFTTRIMDFLMNPSKKGGRA